MVKETVMHLVRIFMMVDKNSVSLFPMYCGPMPGAIELGWLNRQFEDLDEAFAYGNSMKGKTYSTLWPEPPQLEEEVTIGEKC